MDEGRATGPVLVIGGSGTFRHEGRGLTSEIGRCFAAPRSRW